MINRLRLTVPVGVGIRWMSQVTLNDILGDGEPRFESEPEGRLGSWACKNVGEDLTAAVRWRNRIVI